MCRFERYTRLPNIHSRNNKILSIIGKNIVKLGISLHLFGGADDVMWGKDDWIYKSYIQISTKSLQNLYKTEKNGGASAKIRRSLIGFFGNISYILDC